MDAAWHVTSHRAAEQHWAGCWPSRDILASATRGVAASCCSQYCAWTHILVTHACDTGQAYFEHLDRVGGFFYERWGDAPVHSLAAAMFLNATEVRRCSCLPLVLTMLHPLLQYQSRACHPMIGLLHACCCLALGWLTTKTEVF